ncbi:MAG: hypothetical protein HY925_09180 [Elusimicrobia bacterium]|nr:hypothetical protein [Elusimicrobiota bacterium]
MTGLGARSWFLAVVVASVTCLQYPLMAVYRQVWQSKFPALAAAFPNTGPVAFVGGYGTDNMDELDSAAMVQEIARRGLPKDAYVAGSPISPSTDFLAYLPLGLIQKATHDMTKTWFLARWLACVAWFLALFCLARRLGVAPLAAEFCATFGTAFAYLLGLFFLRGLNVSGGLAQSLGSAAWTFVSYGRTENVWRIPRPGISYAALFAAALVWYRAALSEKLPALVLAGLTGGLLCYVRFDVASGLLGAMCVYPVLQTVFQRRFDWKWAAPGAIALVLGIPMLRWALHPGPEFLLKAGMTGLGKPDWETGLYVPLLAWTLWRRRDPATLQTCALLLTVFAICWLPLVNGMSLYTPNWRHYGNIFAFLLLVSQLPKPALESERLWRGLTFAALLFAASLNVLYAGIRFAWQGLDGDYAAALSWLRANAADEAVVASLSPEVNGLVPVFTRCKALIGNGAPLLSRVPLDESSSRILYALDLFGVKPQAFYDEALKRAGTAEPRQKLDRIETDWSYFYGRVFNMAPKETGRGYLDRAEARSFPVQYLWTGPFESSLASKRPAKSKLRLERVYANATVRLDRVLETP